MKKSSTSTVTDAATTAFVVARPTPCVPPFVRSPTWHPMLTMANPRKNGFDDAHPHVLHVQAVGDRLPIHARGHLQLLNRDDPSPKDTHEVGNDRQDRSHQHSRDHARHHELPNGIGAERAQRVDLIGHDHRPELCGNARSHTAGEHQRGQHRPELFHHRRAHETADDRACAELIEREPALQREHGAREDSREQHDGQGSDTDGLELLDDVVKIERAAERVPGRLPN